MRDRLERDRDIGRVRISLVTASHAEPPAVQRSRPPGRRRQRLVSVLIAAAFLAASIAAAEPASAQVGPTGDDVSAQAERGFELHRIGGADRYQTSLQIAQELVEHAGGAVDGVVVASGVSWLDAAVGSSLAGGIDAPLLLVPPGGLRPDALALLSQASVTKVFAVGGTSTLPETDLGGVRDLGVSVERVGGDDPIATALAAAALQPAPESAQSSVPDAPAPTGTPDTLAGLGTMRSPPSRAVVLAGVETSGDAHVAAPFAARIQLPLLFTSSTSLDNATARFLADRAITHAVVTGVHGSPSDKLRDNLETLGISVVQLGNFGSLPASAAAASFSTDDNTGEFASWSRRPCGQQSPSTVGLASNLGPWDAFSAAPLLGHLCAPLVLTSRNDLGSEANAVLYRTLHSGTKSLLIFGSNAVISPAAAEQASSLQVPIRIATVARGSAAGRGGQSIVVLDERQGQRRYLSGSGFSEFDGRSLTWSPQRRHIAFVGTRDGTAGVFVLDIANGGFWRVTPRERDYWAHYGHIAWSADGTKIAFSVSFDESVGWHNNGFTKVHVADMRHRSLRRMTFDDKHELHAGWAPNDRRLLVLRFPADDWDWSLNPDELLIIETDSRQITDVDRFEVINYPEWSPDGSMIAVATWNHRGGTDVARPQIKILDAQEPHLTLLDSPSQIDGILAWMPSGCCLAVYSGYFANNMSLLEVTSGRTRRVFPQGAVAFDPEGTSFRGWSPDGLSIIATDDAHINGYGWWVDRLLMIETLNGEVTELPLDGPDREFKFGGFAPGGEHFVYGASGGPDSVFQLRIVDVPSEGEWRVGLDLTHLLPRLSGIPEDESFASWRHLRWTDNGIHSAVRHWHWPW